MACESVAAFEPWSVGHAQYKAMEKMPRLRAALHRGSDSMDDDERGDLKDTVESVRLREYRARLNEGGENASAQSPSQCVPIAALCTKVCLLARVNIATLSGVEAIVNAANTSLSSGKGVCGAIHSAAGPELQAACGAIGGCEIGDVVITPGFHLPAKHILHAVGPSGNHPRRKELLRRCYTRCLELCVHHGIRSIAFCCLSTGVYRYPAVEAACVAMETVQKFLKESHNWSRLDWVIYVVRRSKDEEAYSTLMNDFFPVEDAYFPADY